MTEKQKTDTALMKRLDNFEEFLPTFLPVIERTWSNTVALNLPRFQQMALHVIQRQPKIMECEALSILGSFATCAEYGLYPDDLRGLVYLVPRWDKDIGMFRCNFMMGYKGYVTCYRRNPMAAPGKSVESERVYEGDEIYIEKGLEPKLKHVPDLKRQEKKDRKLKLVYSILHYREGPPDFDHVFNWQIEQIKQYHSDAKDSGFSPWNAKSDLVRSWMEKKTSLKQVLKLSPALDENLAAAVSLDDRMEVGLQQQLPASLDKETQELVGNLLRARETSQEPVVLPASSGAGTKLDQYMAEKKAEKGSQEPTEKPPDGEQKDPPAPAEPAEEKPLTDKERKAANDKERAELQAYVEENLKYLPEGSKVLLKLTDLRKQKKAIEAKMEVEAIEKDDDKPFNEPLGHLVDEDGKEPEPAESKEEPEPGTEEAWNKFMKNEG
jgi:recombination protein RecT